MCCTCTFFLLRFVGDLYFILPSVTCSYETRLIVHGNSREIFLVLTLGDLVRPVDLSPQ
jgi:hypothetical protein